MTDSQVVGLGGFIGAAGRVLLGALIGRSLRFPTAAVVANAVGPSLIVASVHVLLRTSLMTDVRIALGTWALAGFMLAATFNGETTKLMLGGARKASFLILATAAAGCLLARAIGPSVARALS
jgi:fluoride ion exporter CrcB/FEX